MKRLRIIGLALFALFALGVGTAATASATQLEGLLPLNETFTLEGAKGNVSTFENEAKESLTCTKLTGKAAAEKNSDTHGTATLDFEGCKAGGLFALNSLGDAKETFLVEVLYLVCLIEPTKLLFGLFLTIDKVLHLEAPAVGVLITVEGSVIGDVLPVAGDPKHWLVHFVGEKGKQSVTECKDEKGGVKKHSLKTKSDAGATSGLSWNAEWLILFPLAVEFMDAIP